jgi:uncharacterized membrane protein YbhN (UPF0104 family)
LLATLQHARQLPLLEYLFALGLVPCLYGLHVHVALRLGGSRVEPAIVIAGAVNAWSVGTLTPARAGDLSLAYFLSGKVQEVHAVAIVAADKLVSLGALALLACLSAIFVSVPYGHILVLGAGLVFAAVIVALASVRAGSDSLLGRVMGHTFGPATLEAWEEFRMLVLAPRFLMWCWTAATARWLYVCAINLLIFRAVSQQPGFGHVTAATAVGRIISLVPVSVGGVGVKEPAQILIYAAASVPADAVVAVSVLGMACSLVVAAVAPLLCTPNMSPNAPKAVTE